MIYLGGYSSTISVARETADGLVVESTVESLANPTYLAASPDGRYLFACHELDEGRLSVFDHHLTPLGDVPSGGAGPCHLSVHPGGRYVFTAHWGSGELTVHPFDGGALGAPTHVVDTGKASAHWIATDPSGRWVLAVHLGLGTVTTYSLDDGRLVERHVATQSYGAGPRHLAFHPDGERLFVVNELHSTLTAATLSPDGVVTLGETVSTLPAGVELTNHPSAVRVSPDGRFVLVANRFHDSVAVFTPALELLGTYPCGHFPRDMVLSPDGQTLYVANERADEVVAFRFADGVLTPFGTALAMRAPSCVLPI